MLCIVHCSLPHCRLLPQCSILILPSMSALKFCCAVSLCKRRSAGPHLTTPHCLPGRQVDSAVGRVQWTKDEFGLGVDRALASWPRYRMLGKDRAGVFSLEVQRVALEDDAVFECQVGAAAGQAGIRSVVVVHQVSGSHANLLGVVIPNCLLMAFYICLYSGGEF